MPRKAAKDAKSSVKISKKSTTKTRVKRVKSATSTKKVSKRKTKKAGQAKPTKGAGKFDTLVQDSLQDYRRVKAGDLVEGIVTHKEDNLLVVDIGAKSEGIIGGRDLKTKVIDMSKVKEGDKILVYVVTPESRKGELILSLKRTEAIRIWLDLEKAFANDESVKATVMEANSGGVICELAEGVRGFIPTSQVDPTRIFGDSPQRGFGKDMGALVKKKLTELLGQELEVKIIELDRPKNRIILSEKMVSAGEQYEIRKKTLETVKTGDILEGKVTAVTPYGIFVNAAGLEGLVHLSELSWDKVSNINNLYGVGDDVKVKVLKIEDGGKRVAYSVKALTTDPWVEAIKDYKVGDVVEGKVEKVVDYGAFVRLGKGINGLIHISEMSDKLVRNPEDIVKKDQDIKVVILSISPNERHLGLSLKRVEKK